MAGTTEKYHLFLHFGFTISQENINWELNSAQKEKEKEEKRAAADAGGGGGRW